MQGQAEDSRLGTGSGIPAGIRDTVLWRIPAGIFLPFMNDAPEVC